MYANVIFHTCFKVVSCLKYERDRIGLMHNDVKQCFRGLNVHCGSCSHEQIQYGVSEAGNLNGNNADTCSDVAGPSSSGSDDLFELSDRSNKTDPEFLILAAILDLRVAITPILPFGACYAILEGEFAVGEMAHSLGPVFNIIDLELY